VELLANIADWLWQPVIVLSLVLGLYLTVRTRVLQVRLFPDMIRQLRGGNHDKGGLSPFQTLALTVGNRVGVGNIAGVATAIYAGGPGALFWMGVMALLGGASAFVESTLAQVYKERVSGEFKGGVPYYLEKAFQKRWLGVAAAATALTLYAVLAPGIQANSIAVSVDYAFGVPTWVTGVVVTAILGFIIWGGRRRIIKFVDIAVPLMAFGYIIATLVVLAVNISDVPGAIALIISSAFGADSVFGGIIGAAVAWGVRRALFSNVAGVGEGTYAAGAADVSHPAKQGLVQAFSIYIDTLTICMGTGLMIVVTGSYNVASDGTEIATNLPGVEAGPNFTQAAVDTVWVGSGGPFVSIALSLFALTTVVAFYFIADTNLAYLARGTNRGYVRTLEVVILAVVFVSSIQPAEAVWSAGDIGYASLGLVNIVALFLLARTALVTLRDYDEQRRAGLDPVFEPTRLGIRHADFWVNRTIDTKTSTSGSQD
jgi:alanine or glycine:cation symporter, AGCS family